MCVGGSIVCQTVNIIQNLRFLDLLSLAWLWPPTVTNKHILQKAVHVFLIDGEHDSITIMLWFGSFVFYIRVWKQLTMLYT